MSSVRLTMAQALVRYLAAQRTEVDGVELPLFAGVWAIFGHGNVAGLGEALLSARDELPTLRAHNEQAMALAAVAYAKATNRRRMMACTTSIGPGATNLVTAAANAYVSRLPVLLLPGDIFVSRAPDPVLQQIEDFEQPAVTANDCLRPVSRYWDRIVHPEQLLSALPEAMRVLTDPARCGPVTLALPQDVQAEAYDYPERFFAPQLHRWRRPRPDIEQLERAAAALRSASKPLIIAGGGVHYSLATNELADFATYNAIPVAETQAGKGALPWDHPQQAGAIGATGSSAANALAAEADVVLAVGTRLTDFTTASRTLFEHPDVTAIGLNATAFDALKLDALPLVCDARVGLSALSEVLGAWRAPEQWVDRARALTVEWNTAVERATAPTEATRPSDAQVLGAVNRSADPSSVVVCAAGGLPAELHKLWRASEPGTYHVEYGYSCMGYEIAGGLGVKLAHPQREVYVLVGDGSYLMMNSEIATSVASGHKLIIVLLDNHAFGSIHRLQQSTVGEEFNNLLVGADGEPPKIDFAAHAAALGAQSERVSGIGELEAALERARDASSTCVITIETDPDASTEAGGAWWDIPVAAESGREHVRAARAEYEAMKERQRGVT